MSRDWQMDIERCKELTSVGRDNVHVKALEYWLQQYAAEKERAEKARQLLYDAIGSLVFSTGPNNEHVKRITERFKSLYPKEETKP